MLVIGRPARGNSNAMASQQLIQKMERKFEVPITLIKTGQGIYDIIDLREEKQV